MAARTRSSHHPGGREDPVRRRVVVAGGGIAAVEAVLALRDLAGDRVETVLLAPGRDFVYPPTAVAEPFAAVSPQRIALDEIAADTGARLWRDSLAGIDPEGRAHTVGGDWLPYDELIIATGARRLADVPGAITYRGGVDNAAIGAILRSVEGGAIGRLAFAVPKSVRWPLAAYDLALLAAARIRERDAQTQISLVTHEREPLGLFGRRASRAVAERLAEADVDLRTAMTPLRFQRRSLHVAEGGRIRADCVVALPRLEVPRLTGVPQGPRGFIGTDMEMRVEGLRRVFAAGDATWFPIKQGGIAAQQADAAARSIAALSGADVEPEPFRPVLRGAILTGSVPLFLRSAVGERDTRSAASEEPLWWPPSKLAGRYLAPYLRDRGVAHAFGGPLADLDAPRADDTASAGRHREMVELSLRAADLDAAHGDYRGALRWLQVAEDLAIVLPSPYAERRAR